MKKLSIIFIALFFVINIHAQTQQEVQEQIKNLKFRCKVIQAELEKLEKSTQPAETTAKVETRLRQNSWKTGRTR